MKGRDTADGGNRVLVDTERRPRPKRKMSTERAALMADVLKATANGRGR
jgi:hypothetical protein